MDVSSTAPRKPVLIDGTPWVSMESLRLGDVSHSRLGEAVLISKDSEGPDLRLQWRATTGETFDSVVPAEERDYYMALVRLAGEG